jgi:hypothetical protein
MADTLVYDLASMTEGSPSVFVKKDWLSILDNQNGNYRGNQSVIDTSQLSNSNKYMNYREAYLAVPLVLSASGTSVTAPETAATSFDYALGLKNWYGTLIHSMTLDLNGTTIVQQTPFCSLWNVFKLITSLSWSDIATMGSSIGFYPDNALSFSFSAAASTDGLGTCNTNNAGAVTIVAGAHNSYDSFNQGYLKRQQYINYDADGLTAPALAAYSTLLTATNASQFYKSQIYNKIDASDIFQIQIMAIIYLKHIHSFFSNVPLLKGVFMKMTLNLNQTSVTDTTSGSTSPTHTPSVVSPLGGISPIMITSSRIGVASTATVVGIPPSGGSGCYLGAGGTMTVTLSVGNTASNAPTGGAQSGLTNSIQLYVPAYTFNPVYEQAYLSSPVKRIVYTDIYQYQVSSVAAGGTFNQLITNGIAGIKSVLVLPFYTTAANAAINPLLSPFDTAGGGTTSPLVPLTNFNVVVSGQNMLYNTQKYGYEQWLHNTYGCNAVNGGLTDGVSSSLINQLDWETLYSYYYVNCSRMLPVEESVPKSVSIIGTNLSAKAIDLYVFVEYQVEISIDVLTGARV